MLKRFLLNSRSALLIGMLFLSQFAWAQLAGFTLTVTTTDETCTGNGTLHFETLGTTAGASVLYSVYKLPILTTPIAVIDSPTFSGLAFGTYRVVALQTLGDLSNSQQQEVVIVDRRIPMVYQTVAEPINCLSGNIKVNVMAGNPVSYETLAGPAIVPPQASNVLTNLPLGDYTVRVTDACGDAVVQGCTVGYSFSPQNLVMPELAVQECEFVDCGHVRISVRFQAATNSFIPYPFDIDLVVYPPGGASSFHLNQTVASGDPHVQVAYFTIPFYEDSAVSVGVMVTDPCGNVTPGSTIPVIRLTQTLSLIGQAPDDCKKKLRFGVCNVKLPVTVSFLSTPPGFDPNHFNAQGLGPFNEANFLYDSNDQYEIPSGHYVAQVTDACGRVYQNDYDVVEPKTKGKVDKDHKYYENCVLYFPILIPNGYVPPVTLILSNAPAGFEFPIPHDYSSEIVDGEFHSDFHVPGFYTFTGINACGDPFEVILEVPELEIVTETNIGTHYGCADNGTFHIHNINAPPMTSVIVTEAPESYGHDLPYEIIGQMDPDHPGNEFTFLGFWAGDYTIQVYDACNNVYAPIHFNIPLLLYPGPPLVSILEGCEIGLGSMMLSLPGESNTYLEIVKILDAPPAFNYTLPYDVSFNLSGTWGNFYMNSFPQGIYTFYTKDHCGVAHTFDVEIGNHFFDTTVETVGNCGAFNLFLEHSSSPFNMSTVFLLQRLDPVTGVWKHPLTGYPYVEGSFPNGMNSYILSDNNYNIASQGTFRVMKVNSIYPNGVTGNLTMIPCINVLTQFDFISTLKITDAYKLSCSAGNSQVVIVAGDTAPLTYEIIERNGQPFYVDNQGSNLFSNLTPGLYKFRVTDLCGNIVTRLFDVTTLSEPVITSSVLCDGQLGQLNVQPFSFLSYQWWKADAPGTILSTSSSLHFSPFLLNSTPGTYYVHIYSESSWSCIDTTISYTIPAANDPHAGNDNSITLCDHQAFNLNALLSGQFDSNGIWSETTASGALSGHYWLPAELPAGLYVFTYTVNGFCNFSDQAVFQITLKEALPTPVITVASDFCAGEELSFSVADIPNATFQWSGPNNFNSNSQNPTIPNVSATQSGTYTVTAMANGCETTASVQIAVHDRPEFVFETSCINGNNTLFARPVAGSFNPEIAIYQWQGPNGFTSQEQNVVLNNLTQGQYTLTVIFAEDCPKTAATLVHNTQCSIQSGVSPNHDGLNDFFDLTGFDVLKFEIFNRYGTLVYEQKGYDNRWYGQDYKGRELPDATYYYYIRLKTGEERTGWVYVTKY